MLLFTKKTVTLLSLAVALSLNGCQETEQKATPPTPTSHQAATTASAPISHEHMHHADMPVSSAPNLTSTESVYLTQGKWHDQFDKPFDLNSLTGQKQVVAFIYTSCQAVCPIIMKTMKNIQNKLPAETKAKTGFLVISLDPQRDTPKVLAEFGEHYQADDKWHLLRGSDDDIRMLANTMNIRYQFAEKGMINHSNVISVLNEKGEMIEQVIDNSEAEDKILAVLQRPAP